MVPIIITTGSSLIIGPSTNKTWICMVSGISHNGLIYDGDDWGQLISLTRLVVDVYISISMGVITWGFGVVGSQGALWYSIVVIMIVVMRLFV